MTKIIVANQKAYLNKNDVETFLREFIGGDVIFCPSFPFLSMFDFYKLAAQDLAIGNDASATGEVTATQLRSLACDYVIVGHSERRKMQNETNQLVNKKLKTALEAELTPILCVGETKEEYGLGITEAVVNMQLKSCLEGSSNNVIIAYEPVWAIGTGLTPTNEEISKTVKFIKSLYPEFKVLYGGSVKASNIDELNKIEEIDGYLIGKASSSAQELNTIVKSCQ